MKAILSKSLIPAVLVIAALAAGTSLLAGYVNNRPTQTPQAAAQNPCDGCPLQNTDACPKTGGASADPQMHAAPCGSTAADATPCTGCEGCPMPCCPKTGETPAAGCTMAKPQPTGCPFMDVSNQAVSPCGAGGCTQEK